MAAATYGRLAVDPPFWQKAEKMFMACADLPVTERERWLDEHCGDDKELRVLVISLLGGDQSGNTLQDAISSAARDLATDRADRWVGRVLGAFTIRKRLAEGGMGVVYDARRSDEHFEQRVAIKLLSTALATDELRLRFASERQILANLKHPNIAMLLDGGETDEGVPYLIMEYVEGTFITEFCRTRNYSLERRIKLFLNVCAAVQYAHSNLVVHRDIKPSNIMVTKDGVPKLLDFGIAKLIGTSAKADAELTRVDTRLFTPRNASPEQLRGEAITTATDVYSLGLLLYELLTDAYPYAIDATTSAGQIEAAITARTPAPPSSKAKAVHAKRLCGDLDTIVLKCLRKQPESRYDSAAELAADLRRFMENRPIQARPPTLAYLAGRFWRRHRGAALGIAATLAAVLIGSIATTIGFIQARDAERQALAEARNAEAISGFLTSLFEESDPNTSAGDERPIRDVLESGRQRVATELEDSPLIQSRVLATLSGVYKGLADLEQAEALQKQALALAEQHGAEDLLVARLRNDLGDLYRYQFQRNEALAMIESAVELFEGAGLDASDDWADALNNLGLLLTEIGEHDQGLARLEEALQMRKQLFEAPNEKIALSLHNLAWYYSSSRGEDLALAQEYAIDAVAMRLATFGEIHPRVAASLSLLSRIYQSRSQWDDAERTARRSLAIAEEIYDTGHPDVSFPMYELASVLRDKGALKQAREYFEQVVEWERESFDETDYNFGMSLKALAGVLVDLGDYDEGQRLLRESIAIFEPIGGNARRSLHTAKIDLANAMIRSGQLDEAAELLDADRELDNDRFETPYAQRLRSLALSRLHLARNDAEAAQLILDAYFTLPETPPDILSTDSPEVLGLQAEIYLASARAQPATELLIRSIDILAGRWSKTHWRVGMARSALGRARLDNGEYGAGVTELEAALKVLETQLGPGHLESRATAALLGQAQAGRLKQQGTVKKTTR
jgi:serine/threonine protein kinase